MTLSGAGLPPTSLALLVQYAQWIVLGTITTVVWDAQPASVTPLRQPTFYPDQVVRLHIAGILNDTRSLWERLVEHTDVLVLKPYNARYLEPDTPGIFFLTRNAVPAHGGVPYALPARQTGHIEIGLSQPYRVGGLLPRWISNGLYEPLPVAEVSTVRAALATWRATPQG